MERPGHTHSIGYFKMYVLADDNIDPHSGVGGTIPNPRKLNAAAFVIALAI